MKVRITFSYMVVSIQNGFGSVVVIVMVLGFVFGVGFFAME